MENVVSNIILVFFLITWIVTILLYQHKKKHFDAGSLILGTYTLYAVMALILFNIDNPFFIFDNVQLFPFVYLFLMLLIAFAPILRYDDSKIDHIQKPSTIILNVTCIIFIVASIVQLPSIISDFTTNIVKLVTVSSGGKELYDDSMSNSFSSGDGSIANLASIISNTYGHFGILLLFYYLTLKNRNKFILAGLFIACTISIFSNISLGQRGPIVEILFSLVITYFALRKFIDQKINKLIKIVGLSLVVLTSLPLIYLTNSRFAESDGGSLTSFFYYGGQEYLYFNEFGLDNGGIRYGDRIAPFFKKMLGYENIPNNFWERREKYPNLEINDEVFYTFVGDFTFDFGPYVAPLIFFVLTFFVLKRTKIHDGIIKFHQLILLQLVMCLCMLGGMKLYPFADVGGNLQLIMYAIAYFVFRADYVAIQQRKLNAQT